MIGRRRCCLITRKKKSVADICQQITLRGNSFSGHFEPVSAMDEPCIKSHVRDDPLWLAYSCLTVDAFSQLYRTDSLFLTTELVTCGCQLWTSQFQDILGFQRVEKRVSGIVS